MEDTIYLYTSTKRFKKMAKTSKKKNKSKVKIWIPSFPISKKNGPYLMMKDLGS
jgi:hypothetical protein